MSLLEGVAVNLPRLFFVFIASSRTCHVCAISIIMPQTNLAIFFTLFRFIKKTF